MKRNQQGRTFKRIVDAIRKRERDGLRTKIETFEIREFCDLGFTLYLIGKRKGGNFEDVVEFKFVVSSE